MNIIDYAKQNYVAVFDSGLGGLTVLDALITAFPGENFVYFTDEKFCPYGNRGDDFLINRLTTICTFLAKIEPKVVVIACNTASRFRFVFDEFFGENVVFDVIKPTIGYVADVLKARKVLLLATLSTVSGAVYQSEFRKRNIITKAINCSKFVNYIENVSAKQLDFTVCVRDRLSQVVLSDYDTVIYGCTHFGLADGIIREYLPNNVRIVECGLPTVQLIKKFGVINDCSTDNPYRGTPVFLTTACVETFKRKLSFYGKPIDCVYSVNV